MIIIQPKTIGIVILCILICLTSYIVADYTLHKPQINDTEKLEMQHQADLIKTFNNEATDMYKHNQETNDSGFIFNIQDDEHNYIPIGELTIYNDTWSDSYNTTNEYISFSNMNRNDTYIIESHGRIMKCVPDGSTIYTMYII